ncbi:MAG: hypothetical protein KAT32_03070 [Candidatus Moranbacteria bacterium]|nr:hypothetical protein [Candidatus Moranbacteria bacterium]
MVSFKNESVKQRIEKKRKSQSSSFGVIISFLVLIVVVGVFGVMKFWQSSLEEEIKINNTKIESIDEELKGLMVSEEADFYKRMDVMKKNIYKKHSTMAVLIEIENLVVPSVVLLSFNHSVDNSGLEQIIATFDADKFSFMGQQVKQFKNSEFFDHVRVSDNSRDNVGRLVFTITANVVDSDYILYSEENKRKEIQQEIQPEIKKEVSQKESQLVEEDKPAITQEESVEEVQPESTPDNIQTEQTSN